MFLCWDDSQTEVDRTLQSQRDALISTQTVQLLLARQHSHPGGGDSRLLHLAPIAASVLPTGQLPRSRRMLGRRPGKHCHVADLHL